jgi:hypothetical protein
VIPDSFRAWVKATVVHSVLILGGAALATVGVVLLITHTDLPIFQPLHLVIFGLILWLAASYRAFREVRSELIGVRNAKPISDSQYRKALDVILTWVYRRKHWDHGLSTEAKFTEGAPDDYGQKVYDLLEIDARYRRSAQAIAEPDFNGDLSSAIAGTFSLERVGVLTSVDPSTPSFARIQAAITWQNASHISMTYHIRSMTFAANGMTAELSSVALSQSTLRADKSEMYQGPTLDNVPVGTPLVVLVRYVVEYGPVGAPPAFRSTRAATLRVTVVGNAVVDYHGAYVVEESTEEAIRAEG